MQKNAFTEMINTATIVFPHHLFKEHPAVKTGVPVYLIEETLFFNQYLFHKQKIIYHRATMKEYERFLVDQHYDVHYIEAHSPESDIRVLIENLFHKGISTLYTCEVSDNWLNKRMSDTCGAKAIKLVKIPTPQFINTAEDLTEYHRAQKRVFQTDFYISQRKKRSILVTPSLEPHGGKWSFDTENRLPYPKNSKPPTLRSQKISSSLKEAREYCERFFSKNYGDSTADVIYPLTFAAAETFLREFVRERLPNFGVYEDALVMNEHYLHHSVLSPMLNTGLLLPSQVITEVLNAFAESDVIPINSTEGFIRQIIGWREFIRYVYTFYGTYERKSNFFAAQRRIPQSLWTGNTGITPVDSVIRKLLQTGYTHHIERLMVLGNFMLLCEISPDNVYEWFMTLYIDAYDWVMVPNVYGMSQFADGGLMATKPYISGSNYLRKMGDYPAGDWVKIWDGLFWRFIHKHREYFLKNYRMAMMVRTFDKMSLEKQNSHCTIAEEYLSQLQ